MRKKSTADAKKANVPRVGLFFVVSGKPIVDGLPGDAAAHGVHDPGAGAGALGAESGRLRNCCSAAHLRPSSEPATGLAGRSPGSACGNQRPELPPQLAMKAKRKQSRLGDAPLGRRLLQCKVRPAGLPVRATVFACVFF